MSAIVGYDVKELKHDAPGQERAQTGAAASAPAAHTEEDASACWQRIERDVLARIELGVAAARAARRDFIALHACGPDEPRLLVERGLIG